MVVGAHADAARTATASRARIAETKVGASEERKTYGYKARTDASLAPQPHKAPEAAAPSMPMPSAPKAAAKRAPAKKAAPAAEPEKIEIVPQRTLASKMKPVKKAASKVSKAPTTPTFQSP